MDSLISLLGVLISILVSLWAFLRFIACQSYRLDDNLSKLFLDKISLEGRYKLILQDEFSYHKPYPSVHTSISSLGGMFVYFSRFERMLNAGWQSKELVCELYFFRWNKSRMRSYLSALSSSSGTLSVMALTPWGSERLGELSRDSEARVFLDRDQYEDIESDVSSMLESGSGKTSCLLYGAAGTGKTRFVKYIAQKYGLPVYCVFFNPEYTNVDVLTLFGSIPRRCIVLFEDFDNYFNGRECAMSNEHVKFTFDTILNGLDGVFNNYQEVFFVMTANDISKIDSALRDRPSRFKFVRELKPLSIVSRASVVGSDSEVLRMTEGLTLDKLFFVKSLLESGKSVSEIRKYVDSSEVDLDR